MLKLYNAVIKCVENILNELETIHPGYMDWEFRMPQMLALREAVEVSKNMEIIKVGFKKYNLWVFITFILIKQTILTPIYAAGTLLFFYNHHAVYAYTIYPS